MSFRWTQVIRARPSRHRRATRTCLSEDESLDAAEQEARSIVDTLADFALTQTSTDCFEVLQTLETQKVAL